ncbi:MAG: carboxypeptidase-like regulatory domain-containing protein [Ignavibacteria bacterium]|nr:carboxypeptidase-like regulatory domain-containing protein [Ignavibacteria bacterium]
MHLKYSFKRFFKACLVVVLLIAQPMFAQIGNLKGKVTDKASKDGLAMAIIMIKGTNIGTAADLDGNYFLKNIPAGKQLIVVSYLGYKSETLETTIPRDGTTLIQNFALISTDIEGKEVVVTAQAQGQVSAIQQQLASDKIVNVVSEQRIQQLPDFNAAQAISRLPGVSTTESSGEANKVVIRGLAPQFNAVTVSGISMASTGSTSIGVTSTGVGAGSVNNDRSVDLTMVTPYMIKSIEVFKSQTPDLNANAIGGTVNMNLREAPSGIRSDVMWQSGFTAKTSNYGNYRGVASISNRFFDDAIGVYVLGNMEKYDRDADNMNAGYTVASDNPNLPFNPVQVTGITLSRHKEVRKRYGGNVIADYKFSTGVVRSVNMFSQLNSNFTDHNQGLDFKNNQINFTVRSGENTTSSGVHSLELENDFGFMTAQLKVAGTYSKNSLPWSPYFRFQQTGGVSTGAVPINTSPEELVRSVKYNGSNLSYLNSVNLFSSIYQEKNNLVKGDFKIPFIFGNDISGYLKFGGEYISSKHTNDQTTPYFDPRAVGSSTGTKDINRMIMDGIISKFGLARDVAVGRFYASNFTTTDDKLLDPFLDDKFGSVYWAADLTNLHGIVNYVSGNPEFDAANASALVPGGWFMTEYQKLPNDYDYNEKYSAGYLMSQLNVGQELTIVGGVRWENVESVFHAYNLLDARDAAKQKANVKEVTVNPSNHFVLPMVQMKFNPVSWADVRYSFTQTLARPDYHQLTPHFTIANGSNFVNSGNPNLKPAQAYNHDLMISFHSNELGLLTVGAFYKEIKNFTYSTSYNLRAGKYTLEGRDSVKSFNMLGSPPIDGATLSTYVNSRYKAYIRGLEVDFQTRFWYLPFPFDGLLLGVNYTRINSETRYPWTKERVGGTRANPTYIQIDSSRSGRLIFQPNDIANVFIGYDYEGFSLKVSFVFQGNSASYVGGYPEADGFTDDYFRTDVAVRQKLPWYDLQVFLDVNNVNNRQNISRQTTISGFTNQKNYGLTANLGVRFNLSM